MAACAFLPAVLSNGCAPIRAAVTDTGSLVVFKGGQQVEQCDTFSLGCLSSIVIVMAIMMVMKLDGSGVGTVVTMLWLCDGVTVLVAGIGVCGGTL